LAYRPVACCTAAIYPPIRKAPTLDDMRLPRIIIHSLSARKIQSLTIDIAILLLGIAFVGASASASQLICTPSRLGFGAVVVGKTITSLVTVTNTGQTSLTLSEISGGDAQFTASSASNSNLPLVVPAGQSVDVSVSFTPASTGWTGHTIIFSSNGGSDILPFEVGGTGVTSEALTASPSIVSFGKVAMGTKSTVPVVLTNARSWAVTVGAIQTMGAGFSMSGPAFPLTLGAGQSVTVNVAFTPQSTVMIGGRLFVFGPQQLVIPLTGAGATSVQSTPPPPPPAPVPGTLIASVGSLNFANVLVGSSQPESLTLTNSGGSALTISQAALTGSSSFTLSGLALPLAMAAGQSTTFAVVFAPASGGNASGNLAFSSNASNPSMTLPLSGSAVMPGQLTASPASLAFGSVQSGANVTLTDSLTNTGGTSVTISQATVTGTGFSISGLSFPMVLNPGASVTFTAVFAPQSALNGTGGISVTSTASNPSLTVPLSGTGTAQGQLTVAPTALSFGNATVGTTVSQTSTLTAGGAGVTVSSASLSSAEFSLTGASFPITIAAGKSVPVTLTFTPQSSGTANAVLSVTSNAANTASQTLSGVGVAPTPQSVSLSWTDSGSGVAGYNVFRGNVSGGPYAQINSALAATAAYTDNTVVSGQTYYYVTTAVNESGVQSGYSNEAQGAIPTP
jgi:hypothetical protein